MYISVRICKFEIFGQKSRFKKNVIAIAIAKNMPLYGQTLLSDWFFFHFIVKYQLLIFFLSFFAFTFPTLGGQHLIYHFFSFFLGMLVTTETKRSSRFAGCFTVALRWR